MTCFFFKHNSVISVYRQKMLTTSDDLFRNSVGKGVTGNSRAQVLAAIAKDFIYLFFVVRFITIHGTSPKSIQ